MIAANPVQPAKITVSRAVVLLLAFSCTLSSRAQNPPTQYEIKLLLSHILIKTPDDSGKVDDEARGAAKARAESLLAQAQAGTDFAELARNYSEDEGSAERGGTLGWVVRGQLVQPLESVAFSLGKGQICGFIVESPFGFHILKLEDVRLEPKARAPSPASKTQPAVAPAGPRLTLPPHWPDPNEPRQMAVGQTIEELRAQCPPSPESPHPPIHTAESNRGYECALLAIQMEPDYEDLVDRAARLQKKLCFEGDGHIPSERPATPQGSADFDELWAITTEWMKRWKQIRGELDAADKAEWEAGAEAKRQGNPLAQAQARAHARALRGYLDLFRVSSNCGRGF